jgi:hypothetical protein
MTVPHDYQTPRTTARRIPQRGVYDRDTIHQILDEGWSAMLALPSRDSRSTVRLWDRKTGKEIIHFDQPDTFFNGLPGQFLTS